MFYDRGNRPGFHIFIISSLARNVKYILTESVPVKLYGFAGAFCDPGMCREIAPQGHFLALRAQGATGAKRPRNDKSGNPGANIRAGAEKHFPRARV